MRHTLAEPQDCMGRIPCFKGINICLSCFLWPIKHNRKTSSNIQALGCVFSPFCYQLTQLGVPSRVLPEKLSYLLALLTKPICLRASAPHITYTHHLSRTAQPCSAPFPTHPLDTTTERQEEHAFNKDNIFHEFPEAFISRSCLLEPRASWLLSDDVLTYLVCEIRCQCQVQAVSLQRDMASHCSVAGTSNWRYLSLLAQQPAWRATCLPCVGSRAAGESHRHAGIPA